MGAPSAGTVVLVPFPFSDLSKTKVRPAVVLADVLRGDFVLCQVTSNPYGDPIAVALDEASFRGGALGRMSYARPGKLFTAHETLFAGAAGVLKPEALASIVANATRLLERGTIR